jgi:CRP/FNR family transcriptional regulator, cyclic AMP receptor protein
MDEAVDVLDAIPDLEDALAPERIAPARRHLRARTMTIRRGRWHADLDAQLVQGGLGFLVLEGALVRCVTAAHRTAGELLGPGDLLSPDSGEPVEAPFGGYWRAIEEVRVAVLDARFARVASGLPEILPVLVAGQLRRAGTLSRQLVIVQSQSVEARVVVLLEHLAERWGRVTPDGVVLPSFLSHGTLSLLLGARRPSVTSAMVRLDQRGVVHRREDGRWLLPVGLPATAALAA